VALCAADAHAAIELFSNGRGDQVLVHQVLGQSSRPLYAGLRDANGTFTPLTALAPAAAIGAREAVMSTAGGSVIAWIALDSPDARTGRVLVASWRNLGQLEAPTELSSGAAPTKLALAGNDNGDTLVAWTDAAGQLHESFRPSGGTFGPVEDVAGANGGIIGAALDSDGSATLVWSEGRVLKVARRSPGGEFVSTQDLAEVPSASDITFAAAPNGRALITWSHGGAIMAVERHPLADFGAPFQVAQATSFEDVKDVSLAPSGAAAVAFGSARIAVATRSLGGPFRKPARVGRPVELVAVRTAMNARGDSAVAWSDARSEVHAAYRNARRGVWKRVELAPPLSPSPPAWPTPALALADSGTATAAWELDTGPTVETYTRGFTDRSLRKRKVVDSVPSFVREAPPEACTPQGAVVARSSPSITVSRRSYGEVFACLVSRGVPVRLAGGLQTYVQSTATMRFTGPLLAYASGFTTSGIDESSLDVVDLREPAYGLSRSAELATSENADLAVARLRRNGAVAWVSCPESFAKIYFRCGSSRKRRKQVFVWPSRRESARLVDRGRSIRPRTFKLSGSLLTWHNGRKLHRAHLR